MKKNYENELLNSKMAGFVAGLMVVTGSVILIYRMGPGFDGTSGYLLKIAIIAFAIVPGLIAMIASFYNKPAEKSYLMLGVIYTATGSAFALIILYVVIVFLVGPYTEYINLLFQNKNGSSFTVFNLVPVAGCVILLVSGINLIITNNKLKGNEEKPVVSMAEPGVPVGYNSVTSKFFTSKIPGVLAGVLVIAGDIIRYNGVNSDVYIGSFWGSLTNFYLIVFSIIPAFFGILASLWYNKPGKPSYLKVGISQILMGLLVGLYPISAYFPHNEYTHVLAYNYYAANVVIAGCLIFLTSGIYLVANNSRLRVKAAQ